MRFMIILILIISSHISHASRDVARIEVSLKEKKIFASGMDSTFLSVKLFNDQGEVIRDIEGSELSLTSSAPVKSGKFLISDGTYSTFIRPLVKSENVKLKVSYQGRISSSEIVLETTMAPLKDKLDKISPECQMVNIDGGIRNGVPTEQFGLDNNGPNAIVDTSKNPNALRSFSFEYPQQARQNASLYVFDGANDSGSEAMNSIFMFFPRKNLPYYEKIDGKIFVTLPNGEKIVFDETKHTIVDGVFSEGPVDLSASRFKRRFADLKYNGQGVVLRVNARGQSPQLGQFETNRIDQEFGLTGSVDVLIMDGKSGKRCRRPKKDFWDTADVYPVEFKFPTDDAFDEYLKKFCGFGL
ncbi:MAG: hypothetical protein AB7I27_15150 [Bacteriovoracaceae bacterium]